MRDWARTFARSRGSRDSQLAIALAGVLLTSCGSGNSNNYAAAAIGAAAVVATTGVLRATTGECWARCSPGRVCDHESGLCIEGECYPACGWGQHCERLSGGLMCVSDPNAAVVVGTTHGSLAIPARQPPQAYASPGAPVPLAPTLTPGPVTTPVTQPATPVAGGVVPVASESPSNAPSNAEPAPAAASATSPAQAPPPNKEPPDTWFNPNAEKPAPKPTAPPKW